MSNRIRIFLVALTAVMLVACEDASIIDTGAATGTTPGPGGTPSTSAPRLGSFSGSTFTPGIIAISQATLDAGGSASLTVSAVDTANGNAPITDSISVSFSSSCISQGDSSLSANPATSTTGTATSTYAYNGSACAASDSITATATVSGTVLTASGSIGLVPAPATSILFVSATPDNIGLQGSGQGDTSTLIFQVTNSAGGPIKNQQTTFSLDTTVGGITLTPVTGTTDSQGRVQTIVRSGTVATSVRVTARLIDNILTTADESTVPPAQSDSLVISTGLADQDSFSISAGCFNIEGGDYNGASTNVNIHAADRFNNPVPDGTAIAFRAEGGSIQSSCITGVGAPPGNCSVTFTSQDPRPADHRVTILATAIGEESFNDINGDGRFDVGETFQDFGEAFLDVNEDATRQVTEPFLDFDNSGTFNGPSGAFTGVLCDGGCDADPDGAGPLLAPTSLHARASIVLIMSGSTANIQITPNPIDLSNGPVAVSVLVSDRANQPMPAETTITASTTFGTIAGDATLTQGCTTFNGAFPYTFVVEPPDDGSPGSGSFTIKVTTPGPTFTSGDNAAGTVTTRSVAISTSGGASTPPPPPGNLGSLRFVAATPSTIGIRGSGQPETSSVSFQVLSTTGVPIADQSVTFSLSTTVGGIEQTPSGTGATATTAISDSQGFVTTIVRAGTVHTSVRVTATASPTVFAVSEALVITTGLPDQDSFSLSLTCSNVEALIQDNTQVNVLLLAADRFNNPVIDGTAVAFTTEGGAIVGDCLSAGTNGGECSVAWRSQDPRPILFNNCIDGDNGTVSPNLCDNGPRPGRSTILATAIGEESFNDGNGSGIHEDGEVFGDLGEAFRDDDGDGAYDSSFASPAGVKEEFLDFGGTASTNAPNNIRDGANGLFTGSLCTGSQCDPFQRLHVRDSVLVIMSGSSPSFSNVAETFTDTNANGDFDIGETFTDANSNGQFDDTDVSATGATLNGARNTFTVPDAGAATFSFIVRDINNQPMPNATTVSVAAAGDAGGFVGTTLFTVPCKTDDSAAGNTYSFAFKAADVTEAKTSLITLSVKTPSGLETLIPFTVNTTFVSKCSDGLDNDGDGLVDFAADTLAASTAGNGCGTAADDSE